VPDEDAIAPAPVPIDVGKRGAKGQDAVIAAEVVSLHFSGGGDGAVVGVVEQ
jgi:hypothetical protein